jgi:hypothetical protein
MCTLRDEKNGCPGVEGSVRDVPSSFDIAWPPGYLVPFPGHRLKQVFILSKSCHKSAQNSAFLYINDVFFEKFYFVKFALLL